MKLLFLLILGGHSKEACDEGDLCDFWHKLAAKNGISWPDKQKYSSSVAAVLKQHNVAESAEIGHILELRQL